MNLALRLRRAALDQPDAPAVRTFDHVLTYAELDAAAAAVAAWVRDLGVEPGGRVALMLPNTWQFAALYFGILRAGCVVVPLNPMLREREVDYHVADSGARLLLAWDPAATGPAVVVDRAGVGVVTLAPDSFAEAIEGREPVEAVQDRGSGDTAVILYTSGTTGRPKGAQLTHGGIDHNVDCFVRLLGVTGDDVLLGALPLFHAFGQVVGLNLAVRTGASLSLLPRFDAATALQVIAAHGVTMMAGVPSMYVALLDVPAAERGDTSSLRMVVSGGAALPVEVLTGFEDGFGCAVLEGYGLTETTCAASFNRIGARRPGSIGVPLPDFAFKVVDDAGVAVAAGTRGEIAISGPGLMAGYWNRPEETRQAVVDGWLRTGDIGVQDEDGFFYVVDRKKDLIIRGGYNVYPREIEEVLYEHPAILEAAVVGVPDARLGEEVAAVVTLRQGAGADPDEIREFARARVAAYKYPRVVEIVAALPKTPTGKILKREISLPALTPVS